MEKVNCCFENIRGGDWSHFSGYEPHPDPLPHESNQQQMLGAREALACDERAEEGSVDLIPTPYRKNR